MLKKDMLFPIISFSNYFLLHGSSKVFFPGPVPDRKVKFAKQDYSWGMSTITLEAPMPTKDEENEANGPFAPTGNQRELNV